MFIYLGFFIVDLKQAQAQAIWQAPGVFEGELENVIVAIKRGNGGSGI